MNRRDYENEPYGYRNGRPGYDGAPRQQYEQPRQRQEPPRQQGAPPPPPEKKLGPKGQPMLLRCVSLITVFLVAGAALSLRLSQLQIDEASEWEARASRQQLANITIEPLRGNIYDTNMKLLAQSAAVWTVEASPDVLVQSKVDKNSEERDPARVAARELARILSLDEETLYENLNNDEKQYYKVKSKIDKPAADAITEMKKTYNIGGIYLREDTKRYYPYEEMASTVLGFTGEDNVGLEGLERWYDEVLKGVPGRTMQVIDARGNEISVNNEGTTYPAEDGRSIVLTLDVDLQRSMEKYLAEAVQTHNARQRGFAIAMDVNTGAILALAVAPSYNPNDPYEILDAQALADMDLLPEGSDERIAAQGAARTLQWRNKALADTYEPGSVFKIITAAAALDSGVYTQDSHFYCAGTTMIPGWDKPMGCAGTVTQQNAVHGDTTLRNALINSCNISFMTMAAGMGAHTWYDYLRAFGFTEPTGVDLPGEPSQAAVNNLVYSENALGPVELASCAFGQSNKYTAVQMISAVCAAVNGGNLMQPYIVSKEIDAAGNVLKSYDPVMKRQVISPETSAQICDILEELVGGGASAPGKNAYLPGYRVGGKSGTSQKLDVMVQEERDDAFVSSFLGFAPADNPQIAVLVALDEPEDNTMGNYFGGRLAAPTVRNIIADAMELYGVEASFSTDEERVGTAVKVPKCTDQNVYDAQTALGQAGLTYRIVGGGETVTGQCPAAYSEAPYGGEVVLYTDPAIPQEQCTMPDVAGLTAQNALNQLKGLGLNVITTGAPSGGANVMVISQDIEAGTVLGRGTVVRLVLEDQAQVHD